VKSTYKPSSVPLVRWWSSI